MNIVDIAAGSDDFNLLVRALSAADLVTTVQAATDITVFAPTDAAFTQLAQNLGFDGDASDEDAVFDAIVAALTDLGDGDPIPLLTDILLFHVAGGARTEDTINGSTGIDTLLTGATIMPDGMALGDGEPDLADPKIVSADIMADNGIIQAIDNVLLPIDIPGNTALQTITGIVAASGTEFDADSSDFDMLLAAVQAAGLAGALDAMDADLTVFAPNDGAFIATTQALGYHGDDEEGAFGFLVQALTLLSNGGDPIPLLTAILTYHVSAGAKDATAVLGSTTIDTLQGATLTVDGAMLVDGEPDLPNPTIIATDIAASNGIVHVIDGVLLPVDILQSDGSNDVDFVIGSDGGTPFDLGADNDFVDAGAGDDLIIGGTGNDVILGGDGTDTAKFESDLSDYAIIVDADSTSVRDTSQGGTGFDILKDVELLEFADGGAFGAAGAVDLSILQGAANVSGGDLQTLTELYVAYFDRAPDALGLLFWGNALNEGVSLNEIAELFFEQPETQAKLGGTTNTELVTLAYNHVLERDPDAEGLEFWVTQLDTGGASRSDFILDLIAGARANDAAADDVRTIEDKAEIGVNYALVNGLNNVDNAIAAMDAYERENAESTLQAARDIIDSFAGSSDGREVTVTLVDFMVVDDPMAIA